MAHSRYCPHNCSACNTNSDDGSTPEKAIEIRCCDRIATLGNPLYCKYCDVDIDYNLKDCTWYKVSLWDKTICVVRYLFIGWDYKGLIVLDSPQKV